MSIMAATAGFSQGQHADEGQRWIKIPRVHAASGQQLLPIEEPARGKARLRNFDILDVALNHV